MAEAVALNAYYIDEPERKVDTVTLLKLGVKTWRLDADKCENDPELERIRKEQGYSYHDFVHSKNIPNLADKLDTFKTEHIHLDDEIRYFLDGSGYFDVRDGRDQAEPWIRIHAVKGDMITLPAGIYHRFMPDEKLSFHVMRLFQGEPVWTSYNRGEEGTEDKEARKQYVQAFLAN